MVKPMEIELIDFRKLKPAAREQLSKTAVLMHRQALKQAAIADDLAIRRSTISKVRNGEATLRF